MSSFSTTLINPSIHMSTYQLYSAYNLQDHQRLHNHVSIFVRLQIDKKFKQIQFEHTKSSDKHGALSNQEKYYKKCYRKFNIGNILRLLWRFYSSTTINNTPSVYSFSLLQIHWIFTRNNVFKQIIFYKQLQKMKIYTWYELATHFHSENGTGNMHVSRDSLTTYAC